MKPEIRGPRLIFLISWFTFASSWFLPVVKNQSWSKGVPGWGAFLLTLGALWPSRDSHFDHWYTALLSCLSVSSNLIFPATLWAVIRGVRSTNRLVWISALAFMVNAHWLITFGADRADLGIGYYLWWVSFLVMGVALYGLRAQAISPAPLERLALSAGHTSPAVR